MLWTLALFPLVAGLLLWAVGGRGAPRRERLAVGLGGGLVLTATTGLGVWAAWSRPAASYAVGAGLTLLAEVDEIAAVAVVLVPAVALPIVAYAAAHEPSRGLARQVGLLVAFVGGMELVVVAADLLTLLVGWELIAAISWGLIAHGWWEPGRAGAAAHAFNATRAGDLGLLAAAGAALAATGSFGYLELETVQGGWLHVIVAGVVVAAVAKAAQVPFSPWLFSAMAGPTPVSALLHAATLVAAGPYLLARLAPVLEGVGWFGPVTVTVGLATAVGGGVVASLQDHPKKLLAASTSAHAGLMVVAVGAGSAAVGMAHLTTHAAFKSLLFLAAGTAVAAAGSERLGDLRVGSALPRVAGAAAAGTLALAAVPPLGGAWSKEKVLSAAAHLDALAALGVALAGALSAFYAARFHLLAFGRVPEDQLARTRQVPGAVEVGALAALAAVTVALSVLWLPPVEDLVAARVGAVPVSRAWEQVLSMGLVGVGLYAAWAVHRRGRLAALGQGARAADWLGLPSLSRRGLVDPSLALCAALARFDDRVVDAGVRAAARVGDLLSRLGSGVAERGVDGVVELLAAAGRRLADVSSGVDDRGIDRGVEELAGGLGQAGRDSRRLHTGYAHHYYVLIVVGVAALLLAATAWR